MNNKEINNRIRSAVSGMTPDLYEAIAAASPVGNVGGLSPSITPYIRPRNRGRRVLAGFAAAAAVLALTVAAGAYYNNTAAVAAVITLDVNPSVEISANKNDRVVNAKAANADGEKILNGMNFKNTDIDVAMNAIVGSMVQQGYLSPHKNSILVSVSAADETKSNEIRYNVVSTINETLAQSSIPAHIYNQTLPAADKALKAASKEQGISYGKLSFLEKITAVDPSITIEQLSEMTLDEIDALLATHRLKPYDFDLDDDNDDYCEFCGKPESECRKSCDRRGGKRYCDDCGRPTAACICVDDDLHGDDDIFLDDDNLHGDDDIFLDDDDLDGQDRHENNRDKGVIDNRPDHSNANTDNSNRYKDKFDGDYCDYCGRLESICLDSCSRSDGKRYCDDCGKLFAECVCTDKNDRNDIFDDLDDKFDDDDDDDDHSNGNSGKVKEKPNNKNKPDKNKPFHDDDDRDDD